ncbi:SDR family NAD(P)-dependent oxidoreductase [Rhodococcus sp. SORGH_AS_0301]|uniref:SDR family NAD(P)-dependent oxidoreductase n=1 Tax=Rhodococcus sp. SORGH_AS_0301 TaxID=3041780 RepID=UPI0027837031|nr:SDR family oxidoreductase [Rhodococcus sp. SORGH_AS_0301]MDQ1179266.1 NAD(P)-dependent dehydrogenase (short-subunit alcohol dehydrogenase family) [Rhodococcus sp. SORGH_AS_0301]
MAVVKHAVVTGVSSGIGAATALSLLDDGWRVTGLSRRKPEIEHENLTWVESDLGDLDAVAEIASGLSAVDAVVHAAGLQRSAPLGSLNVDDLRDMWQVHVAAAEVLVNGVVDALEPGARVVLVGSRTMTGNAGKSQYVATKSALTGMARSWAMELVSRGITVNVVAPGPTDTAMLGDPSRAHTPPKLPPLGAFIDPSEVAGLIGFLLGPLGRNITGQAIVQCAGASL